MKRIILLACGGLTACAQSGGIDPAAWNCENLIPHVVEMSRGRTPEVIEISRPQYMGGGAGHNEIKCWGTAEWTQGSGGIEYGAHISDGGQVILEYRQM